MAAGPLRQNGGPRLACDAGHAFDRARSGYVDLLQPQDSRARAPGDPPASSPRGAGSSTRAPGRRCSTRWPQAVGALGLPAGRPRWTSARERGAFSARSPRASASMPPESTSRRRPPTSPRAGTPGCSGSSRTPTAGCRSPTPRSTSRCRSPRAATRGVRARARPGRAPRGRRPRRRRPGRAARGGARRRLPRGARAEIVAEHAGGFAVAARRARATGAGSRRPGSRTCS